MLNPQNDPDRSASIDERRGLPAPAPAIDLFYRLTVAHEKYHTANGIGTSTYAPALPLDFKELMLQLEQRPWDHFLGDYFRTSYPTGALNDQQIEFMIERCRARPQTMWLMTLKALAFWGRERARDFLADFKLGVEPLDPYYCLTVAKYFSPTFRSSWRAQKALEVNRLLHQPFDDQAAERVVAAAQDLSYHNQPAVCIPASQVADSLPVSDSAIDTGMGLRLNSPEETRDWLLSIPRVAPVLYHNREIATGCPGFYCCAAAPPLELNFSTADCAFHVAGTLGATGKGFTRLYSQLSLAMEYSERLSAYAGSLPDWPNCFTSNLGMIKASFLELQGRGERALDPQSHNLEPLGSRQDWYRQVELHQVRGEVVTAGGSQPCFIPAQLVFHCSCFDEPALKSEVHTNGLASGRSLPEAKRQALLELFERDAFYTTCYDPRRVFKLAAAQQPFKAALEYFEERGIAVRFMDITTPFGIPAYKAFAKLGDEISIGMGADLNARIAIGRALGELLPNLYRKAKAAATGGSAGENDGAAPRAFESLPNYSTGAVEGDLRLLERLLLANGLQPYYVDLTTKELGIPVVRAIIPSFDIPDTFTQRQYESFLTRTVTPSG